MAKEMMEFTKNNIISQAATAMLEGLAAWADPQASREAISGGITG